MPNRFEFSKQQPEVTPDQVLDALRNVLEPAENKDIVSLGMVKDVSCQGGVVRFTIKLRQPGTPLQVPIERMVKRVVSAIPGVADVQIRFQSAPTPVMPPEPLANFNAKHVIAVASGKGGVGKTTVAVNLAVALAKMGERVGLLDGDIQGPNVPIMLGIAGEKPVVVGDQVFPPSAYGVKVMSMGLVVPEGMPLIWRGPMMHQALGQLVKNVMWGNLDYLILDLPPGTGDIQLSLVQTLQITGGLMVTTPQGVAIADVIKGAEMFRQLDVPLIGVVENMSYYVCPDCGSRKEIFLKSGGKQLAERMNIPLIGQLPLDGAICDGSDNGKPVVEAMPDSEAGRVFSAIAQSVANRAAELAKQKKQQFIPLPMAASPKQDSSS